MDLPINTKQKNRPALLWPVSLFAPQKVTPRKVTWRSDQLSPLVHRIRTYYEVVCTTANENCVTPVFVPYDPKYSDKITLVNTQNEIDTLVSCEYDITHAANPSLAKPSISLRPKTAGTFAHLVFPEKCPGSPPFPRKMAGRSTNRLSRRSPSCPRRAAQLRGRQRPGRSARRGMSYQKHDIIPIFRKS